MTVKRRIKITATQIRRQRIHSLGIRVFCPSCAQEVETLGAGAAAEVLEVSAAALASLIAAGQVHAMETVSGSRRICQDSLFIQRRAE